MSSPGRSLAMARVSITDGAGFNRSALTNSFGYYRFDDVPAGATYVVSVAAKRYTFTPRAVNVLDELTGINFVADQ